MVKGEAIEWTDEELAALIEVSPADVERARVWWMANAPPEAKDILDAEEEDADTEAL